MAGGAFQASNSGSRWLERTSGAAFQVTDELTLFGYFWPLSGSTINKCVIGKYNFSSNKRQYCLYVQTGGGLENLSMAISGDGVTAVTAVGATDYGASPSWVAGGFTGTYTFIAGVYVPSASLAVYYAREPGELVEDAVTTTGVPASLHTDTANFLIGHGDGWGTPTEMAMTRCGVINAAASQDQLRELSFGTDPRELFGDDVVGYWHPYGQEDGEYDWNGGGLTMAHNANRLERAQSPQMMIHTGRFQTLRPTAAVTTPGPVGDTEYTSMQPIITPSRPSWKAVPYGVS